MCAGTASRRASPGAAFAPPDELGNEIKTLVGEFKDAVGKVEKLHKDVEQKVATGEKLQGELKDATDKILTDVGAITARLLDVEQKLARPAGPAGGVEHKTPGQRVAENEAVKAAGQRGDSWKGSLSVEVKAITSASATGTSATTALVPADRVEGKDLPRRPMTIRALLMPGRTASSIIEYARQTVRTLNAATVAENPSSAKPQSDIQWDITNTKVATIAHWIPTSKQILADAPQLQSEIDGELRYGLEFAEEQQLLLGDGTGTNLLGLMPQATAYAAPSGVKVDSETRIDRIRLAMLQATLALYPATGHVLNPTDWAAIELTKDSQGRYIWANPAGLIGPTLWGLPVAVSLAMPQNNFLTGRCATRPRSSTGRTRTF